jgi:hypothetical protein
MKQALLGGVAALTLTTLGLAASPALADTNILPANWDVIQTFGTVGVLRAGSPWAPGVLAAQSSIVDGAFVPESQQWNIDSWWWDEDPSVNAAPVPTTIHLNNQYTIDRFVVQADNNDTYLLEYWNGASWLSAWTAPAIPGFGLETRDSGALTPFTTDFLRFTATSGDNYYSVSEIQAFGALAGVPEPAAWALMILGFGGVGAAMRRRGAVALG